MAIRRALLYPRKRKCQNFLNRLLGINYAGKRAAADKRRRQAGRTRRVAELEAELRGPCNPYWQEPKADTPPHARYFLNLVNELLQRCTGQAGGIR